MQSRALVRPARRVDRKARRLRRPTTPLAVLVLASLLLLGMPIAAARAQDAHEQATQPSVHYVVGYAGTSRDDEWHVYVECTGLSAGEGELHVHLEDWGEWTEID